MTELFSRVHSIETCGTVDGPGIRTVVFMQGCCLRCAYCHNPDTWEVDCGDLYSVKDLVQEIVKYKSYMKFSGGGLTVSGGEPLLQAEFLCELFIALEKFNIHRALDTSGCIVNNAVERLLNNTDLVLLDFKNADGNLAKEMGMCDPSKVLAFLDLLMEKDIPVWLRHVLIPGITDKEDLLTDLAQKIAPYKNIERVELLPYHKIGEYKWAELGKTNKLADIPPASKDDMLKAKEILNRNHIKVFG